MSILSLCIQYDHLETQVDHSSFIFPKFCFHPILALLKKQKTKKQHLQHIPNSFQTQYSLKVLFKLTVTLPLLSPNFTSFGLNS